MCQKHMRRILIWWRAVFLACGGGPRGDEIESLIYLNQILRWKKKLVLFISSYQRLATHRKTTAWFSEREPSLVKALSASSSAPPMADPSFPPSGPLLEEAYVLSDINAWDESCAVGKETWNRLARCAVRCVSD